MELVDTKICHLQIISALNIDSAAGQLHVQKFHRLTGNVQVGRLALKYNILSRLRSRPPTPHPSYQFPATVQYPVFRVPEPRAGILGY